MYWLVGCSMLALKQTQLNSGQAGDGGRDINVEPAWLQGLTGSGVTVAIVDDGESSRYVLGHVW